MDSIQYIPAKEAVQWVESKQRVFIQGGSATPQALIDALTGRSGELEEVEICHLHTEGNAPYAFPQYEKSFRINNFFIGSNIRPMIGKTLAQYIPVFLSEIPSLFRKKILPLDVALIQVSPPDKHGFCSLGLSVDITRAAVDMAKVVIAQVNPQMPRSHGDGIIHLSDIKAMVWVDTPLYEHDFGVPSSVEAAIGKHIAGLVEDGACLQMGIGGIPNAVLQYLDGFKNLGVHTEMFSDGIMPLVEKGVIDGSRKTIYPGKIVSSFAMGSRKLYDFIDDNPMIAMLDVSFVNDPGILSQNTRVMAINSAIEVDLTGQVCADSIGSRMYSGVGGQMDFIRGAALSEGGKPVIALPSVTGKRESKIVPVLKSGAGVVTTRAHVHYVVTEFGIADLYGKNLAQRAKELIRIAHPMHREKLEKEAYELFGRGW
ncbi:MAG: 4-hydroxybutyrate CoA-transferase [Bacteroidia bacterium]|nr:4-hydroxybutyrate CoA-transferase [Bacteroidia bacterium]